MLPGTAKLVKGAIKALRKPKPADTAAPAAAAPTPMPTKSEVRKLIDAALGELLVLLSENAAHYLAHGKGQNVASTPSGGV